MTLGCAGLYIKRDIQCSPHLMVSRESPTLTEGRYPRGWGKLLVVIMELSFARRGEVKNVVVLNAEINVCTRHDTSSLTLLVHGGGA